MEESVVLQNIAFAYQIQYKHTRIFKLRFKEGKICVVAPYFSSKKRIMEFICNHQDFILKQYEKYQIVQKKNEIHEKDDIRILGKEYMVIFHRRSFVADDIIYINQNKQDHIKDEIKRVFKPLQETYFKDLTLKYYQMMPIPECFPEIKIKNVRSKWGSYNKTKNQIDYSSELLFKEPMVYDYIVVHELAHMIEFNHSKNFYRIVEYYCPNYKTLRKQLKDVRQ